MKLETPVAAPSSIAATLQELLDRRVPNFLRLHLQASVAQTCVCLSELVAAAWPSADAAPARPSFLANGREEAVSGALKLARCHLTAHKRPVDGLLVDPCGHLDRFAAIDGRDGSRITLIPGLTPVADDEALVRALATAERPGLLVLAPRAAVSLGMQAVAALRETIAARRPLVIECVDRPALDSLRRGELRPIGSNPPDVVVFDESFVDHAVPFAAFTARSELFRLWRRRGMTTFHSTTFQPNAVSTSHFLRSLSIADPDFLRSLADELTALERDPERRRRTFAELYSPSLVALVRAAGLERVELRAEGHYVLAGERRCFDLVAGVACSVRGHNPPGYLSELEAVPPGRAARDETRRRLDSLTGLGCSIPAVSGATAVETALKIGLAAQAPRRRILALSGGFGGKTLLALAGTAKPSLKRSLAPLYPDVVYIDPFAPDAVARLDAELASDDVAIVQMELVQGVGGVRAVPPTLVRRAADLREKHGHLLLVDEVQTGAYRTGPFTLSREYELRPDLLTLGKAVSDMMFPYAFTLGSEAVFRRAGEYDGRLVERLAARHDYEWGWRTTLNLLRRAERDGLEERVRAAGRRFAERLGRSLANCRSVLAVRCFGLLIGVELAVPGGGRDWRAGLLTKLRLAGLLNRRPLGLIVGYCQYEPQVLKLTPPLSITDDEIDEVCDALTETLSLPTLRLAWNGLSTALSARLPS